MPHGSEVNCLDGPIKLTMMTSHGSGTSVMMKVMMVLMMKSR